MTYKYFDKLLLLIIFVSLSTYFFEFFKILLKLYAE